MAWRQPISLPLALLSGAAIVLAEGSAAHRPRVDEFLQTRSNVAPSPVPAFPSEAILLILEPGLRFERVTDEVTFSVPRQEEQKFKSILISVARQAVRSRGIPLHQLEGPDEQIVASVAALEARSARLGRGQVMDDARSLLRQLAEWQPDALILAQHSRIKEGPGGSWDPFSGAIRSSASTADLHAALIACRTGDVLWKNAVSIRKRPRPGERAFQDAVRQLFASLANGEQRKER